MHQCFLDGDHHAANINVDKGVDIRQRHGFQRATARNAGVVDQNIQPAEGACRLRDGILDGLRTGTVGLYGLAVSPQRVDLIDDLLGFIRGFFIRNNHIGTGACQRQCNGTTQPTAGTGNQRLLTC